MAIANRITEIIDSDLFPNKQQSAYQEKLCSLCTAFYGGWERTPEKKCIAWERNNIALERNIIAWERNIFAFERNIIAWERNIIAW